MLKIKTLHFLLCFTVTDHFFISFYSISQPYLKEKVNFSLKKPDFIFVFAYLTAFVAKGADHVILFTVCWFMASDLFFCPSQFMLLM